MRISEEDAAGTAYRVESLTRGVFFGRDLPAHLRWNGPWRYRLSEIYYAPEVEAALVGMSAAELKAA